MNVILAILATRGDACPSHCRLQNAHRHAYKHTRRMACSEATTRANRREHKHQIQKKVSKHTGSTSIRQQFRVQNLVCGYQIWIEIWKIIYFSSFHECFWVNPSIEIWKKHQNCCDFHDFGSFWKISSAILQCGFVKCMLMNAKEFLLSGKNKLNHCHTILKKILILYMI